MFKNCEKLLKIVMYRLTMVKVGGKTVKTSEKLLKTVFKKEKKEEKN